MSPTPWKLIPLVIKEPHWVGLTTWQLGREGFQHSGGALSPQGFPLISDNAYVKAFCSRCNIFHKTIKESFQLLGISIVTDFKELSDDPHCFTLAFWTSWLCLIEVNSQEAVRFSLWIQYFFSQQNDLRYLLFLPSSLFNLHLMKQYTVFHSMASWCCDSFPVALWVAPFVLFPVFTLAFPFSASSLLPAARFRLD